MAEDYKGKIDFAIITIREDENRAVLKRFPAEDIYAGKHRSYAISRVSLDDDSYYLVAIIRSIEQGEGHSQDVARDLIEDLDPQWILLVGIAGGVPAAEFTLGDVVAAMRLTDFSVKAALEGRDPQYAVSGGPMHKKVQDLLALLPAMSSKLGNWNSEASIGMKKPNVNLTSSNFYGSDAWKSKTKEMLTRHFGRAVSLQPPVVTTGTIVSSDTLMKDTQTFQQWQEVARQLIAVEMELGGVYIAARRSEKEYPILAIRGISDIVGFKRHPDWTEYACQSAAAFVHAFVLTRPVVPRNISSLHNSQRTHNQENTEDRHGEARWVYCVIAATIYTFFFRGKPDFDNVKSATYFLINTIGNSLTFISFVYWIDIAKKISKEAKEGRYAFRIITGLLFTIAIGITSVGIETIVRYPVRFISGYLILLLPLVMLDKFYISMAEGIIANLSAAETKHNECSAQKSDKPIETKEGNSSSNYGNTRQPNINVAESSTAKHGTKVNSKALSLAVQADTDLPNRLHNNLDAPPNPSARRIRIVRFVITCMVAGIICQLAYHGSPNTAVQRNTVFFYIEDTIEFMLLPLIVAIWPAVAKLQRTRSLPSQLFFGALMNNALAIYILGSEKFAQHNIFVISLAFALSPIYVVVDRFILASVIRYPPES